MSESKIKAARLKFMKRAPSNLHESSSDKVLNLNCQRKGIPISVPKEGYDDNDDSEHSRFKREIDQSFPPLALPTRQTGNILTKKFPPSSGYSNGASNLKLEENPMAAGSSSFPSSRLVKPTIHHSSRSHGSLGPQSRPWTSSIPPVEQSPPNSSTQNSHLSSRLGSEHLSVNDGRSTAISSPHQEKSVIETSTWAEEDQSLILRLDAATASPTRDERPAQRGDIADLNLTQRDHAAIACPPRGKATVQKQPPKKKPSLFLNSSSSRGRINPIRQDQTSKNTNSRLISPRKSISQRASNG
ncbi:hypothetical protein DFH28DRAFT_893764 [Melampsora americana]|nr:hypothetical protein DFH28DRAFT_893764 [Melampsora americana]